MVRFPDPNNTKTIGRMIGNCFLGESFQAAPTLPTLSDSIMGNLNNINLTFQYYPKCKSVTVRITRRVPCGIHDLIDTGNGE